MTEKHDYIEHLRGLTLWKANWSRPSVDWDHDHCAVCIATFSDTGGANVLHEGYATGPDYVHGARYEWVCNQCFARLQSEMDWSVGSAQVLALRGPAR